MIYYFSGTGNSLTVARRLADLLGEQMEAMTSANDVADKQIGLVFPVYAWGLPRAVEDFIAQRLTLPSAPDAYTYIVMTCGDDMGYADRVAGKLLLQAGRRLDAAFSVMMPNTYVCLPGFDVDAEQLAARKLSQTMEKLPEIANIIRYRQSATDVWRGPMPWLKTYVIRPLFDRLLITDRYFHTEGTLCTSCGKCLRACPMGNMQKGEDGRPGWKGRCTGCLACYHACPAHAIRFGRMTDGKGQQWTR